MPTGKRNTRLKHTSEYNDEDNPQYRNKAEVIKTLGLSPEQLSTIEEEAQEWLLSRPDICSLETDVEKEAVSGLIADLYQKHVAELNSTDKAIYHGLKLLVKRVLYNQRRRATRKPSGKASATKKFFKLPFKLQSGLWQAIYII